MLAGIYYASSMMNKLPLLLEAKNTLVMSACLLDSLVHARKEKPGAFCSKAYFGSGNW